MNSLSDSVFVSYASTDLQAAQEIAELIAAMGTNCWMAPDSILPGERYPVAIANAIRNCGTFLLVFSRASDSSDAVMNEIELATRYRKRVVPVRIEEAEPGNLAYYLGASQWVDYFKPGGKVRLRTIVRTASVDLKAKATRDQFFPTLISHRPPGISFLSLHWLTTIRVLVSISVGYASYFWVFQASFLTSEIVGPTFGVVILLWRSPVKALFSRRNAIFAVFSTLIWSAVDYLARANHSRDDLFRMSVLLGSVLLPLAQAAVFKVSWIRAGLAALLTYGAFEAGFQIIGQSDKIGLKSAAWALNPVTLWQFTYLLSMYAWRLKFSSRLSN